MVEVVASIFLMRKSNIKSVGLHPGFRFLRSSSGQSLLEVAMMLPLLLGLVGYAVDYGYYFIAAANLTSSARNAVQYSVLGYQTAGPGSNGTSVVEEALGDLTSLRSSSTTATIQVCSKSLGTTGNLTNCASYGPTATTYTPAQDPEAPHFYLQRVDVTYTVQPPVPMTFFNISLIPLLKFHRQVSMRAMD
jgi:Flp pilus assembly protein TadG